MLKKCTSIAPRLHYSLLPWSRRLNTQPILFSFASPKPSSPKQTPPEVSPDGLNSQFSGIPCNKSGCPQYVRKLLFLGLSELERGDPDDGQRGPNEFPDGDMSSFLDECPGSHADDKGQGAKVLREESLIVYSP